MKILALADETCKALYDFYSPGKLAEYDLILACGDLRAEYLSFIVTMARCPVFYVHGNHDAGYEMKPPLGCDCVEDKIVVYKGLRVLGLGGSFRYRPGEHQYTEKEMAKRIRKLRWKLRKSKGVDIVITHAPAAGLGDMDDPAHKGFACFLGLMEQYHPRYLVHGHVHPNYDQAVQREHIYGDTKVINAFERYTFEIPDDTILPCKWKGDLPYV